MKLVALFSGGKDSIYAIQKAKEQGHNVEKLATAVSKTPQDHLFYTPNVGLAFMQSRLLGMQLISKGSTGLEEKEKDDLKILLSNLGVEGVVCGAIASDYEKDMIESVCKDLRLKFVAPLWGSKPRDNLKEMLEQGFKITIIFTRGLDKSWLGKVLEESDINKLKDLGISIGDEGRDIGTLVLDCPLYSRGLEITKAHKESKDKTGTYIIEDAKFLDKT